MIQGKGFVIHERKFDYFFGRVASSSANARRSQDNLETLQELGIKEATGGKEMLLQFFQRGLDAPIVRQIVREYGITIVRKVEVSGGETLGSIEISYFYRDGDLSSLPEIVSIIPKIYRK